MILNKCSEIPNPKKLSTGGLPGPSERRRRGLEESGSGSAVHTGSQK